MFIRFIRFNVVGAMGVAVQIAALTLLVSGLGVHYLPATALAIELSVLHNFLWHERWTWGDRTGRNADRMQNAECRMKNVESGMQRAVWARLVAFHAGNGLVSMAGSLVLMPVFVGWFGLHYIVANLSTIAATGLFNFLLGDKIVFRAVNRSSGRGSTEDGRTGRRPPVPGSSPWRRAPPRIEPECRR